MTQLSEQAQKLLQLIPESSSIGNVTLRRRFSEKFPPGIETADPDFFKTYKTELLNAGVISLGRGKGGSVKRVISAPVSPETGQVQNQTEIAATEEF